MSYMDTYKKWCTDSYFDEETRKELLATGTLPTFAGSNTK